jgi:hypothetical protein
MIAMMIMMVRVMISIYVGRKEGNSKVENVTYSSPSRDVIALLET